MKRAVFLLSLALVAPSRADEGRRPIDGRTVITEPGSYVVTRDFASTVDAIRIEADGVTVDLNGRTVTGYGSLPAVYVLAPPTGIVAGVTVKNGNVSGGRPGILVVANGGPIRFEQLNVRGADFAGINLVGAEAFEIVDCSIYSTAGPGIWLQTTGNDATVRLEHNLIANVSGAGIDLQATRGAVVTDNVIRSPGAEGIRIEGPGARVVGNTVFDATALAPAAGIRLIVGDGARVADNVVTNGAGVGIHVSGSTFGRPLLLEGNVIRGHADNGLEVALNDALVEHNRITGNLGFGLALVAGAPVPYRNNMLRGNTAGSVDEATPGLADDRGGNICDGSCP